MSGGDQTAEHNAVRDVFFDFCERGALGPLSEPTGLLAQAFPADSDKRPADVLVVPSIFLARKLPNGGRAVRADCVALDFAVINALGDQHHVRTSLQPGSAADSYGMEKMLRNNTFAKCQDVGILFKPVVLEKQGGMSKDALAVVRGISEAVAVQEGRTRAAVEVEFRQRLAVVVARSNYHAIRRRKAEPRRGPNLRVGGLRQAEED